MNKYTVFFSVFLLLGLFGGVQAQDTTKCYLDYLELSIREAGKTSKLNLNELLSAENLPDLKINSSKKLNQSYLNKIRIEITLAKETERISSKTFVGINVFNTMNSLSFLVPMIVDGARLILDIKYGEAECSKIFSVPVSPSDVLKFRSLRFRDIVIDAISNEGDSILEYGGINFNSDYISPSILRNIGLHIVTDSAGRIYLNKHIRITNCNFNFGLKTHFDSISFKSLYITRSQNTNLGFTNCKFQWSLVLSNLYKSKQLLIANTEFSRRLIVEESDLETVRIRKSTVLGSLHSPTESAKEMDYRVFMTGRFARISLDSNRIQFSVATEAIKLSGAVDDLNITSNRISSLNLQEVSVSKRAIIADNSFSKNVFMYGAHWPEKTTEIYWKQLAEKKLALMAKAYNEEDTFYSVESQTDLKDELSFKRLMKTYQELEDIYITNGDKESANSCYSEMKQLEGMRLAYLYQKDGGFQRYFRWKLNQLMKFYTDHGTDPARAIVISIWVVLFFGIFYFFFPSDWDVTSKGKLLQRFRDFVEKNEKGYIKPFIALLLGFTVSLINAFTLSLNSFTTLGFGNIPTHGLARYVCVIEGFIGWFLLSIFTVALISQV